MISDLPGGSGKQPHVLLFCQHTASAKVRSGVQRVVVELARELTHHARVDFVRWDDLDGQLRLMDRRDLRGLFGVEIPPNPACHRTAARFGDLFEDDSRPWLLFPEIPSHLPDGNEKFSRIVSQCREYRIRVAAIFYDLIPVREAAYAAGRPSHLKYMAELVRCDMIIPISKFAADDLISYYKDDAGLTAAELEHLRSIVRPIALGESRRGESWANASSRSSNGYDEAPHLMMVGTVEPRKQQTRLLRILNDGCDQFPILQRLEVDIFGSLHPDSSDALWAEAGRNPNIRFHHYVPEEMIEAAYARASFTAFPSLNEGYGLPIVESLRRGVPCLTADFGAMLEVAHGGGCVTIDVRDDGAILRGLVELASDAALRRRLREQIESRPRRSWIDYAADIAALLAQANGSRDQDTEQFCAAVEIWMRQRGDDTSASLAGRTWHLVCLHQDATSESPPATDATGTIVRLMVKGDARSFSREALGVVARADLLILDGPMDRRGLAQAASRLGLTMPLPDALIDASAGARAVARCAVTLTRSRAHVLGAAFSEAMYQTACQRAPVAEGAMDELAIVISTYNRGPFVEMNIDWLLRQIDEHSLPVRCVVVDNTSTDDTAQRLARFFSHPKFRYECNSANTGMLGNLRVCSTKVIARYLWVTGDDDFVAPGAIARTLAVIRQHPGVPLILHNFGVYHRERITPGDNPSMFFTELQPLASSASTSGTFRVNQIAGEHDNLFTAVYPIVFRSDLLAACFNYPFDGVPFGDLVECVPTTKFILETLPCTTAHWFKEIGIVGNAHNSWSGHRPRWHLVLMPEVMRLARRAGVDAEKLWSWGCVHEGLFNEAVSIAIARNMSAHLADPEDFESASYFFRKDIVPPPNLRLGLRSDRWISSSEVGAR